MNNDVALSATFMVTGMIEYDMRNSEKGPDGRNSRDIYILWDQGALELHQEMIGYAVVMDKCLAEIMKDKDIDFCGVIDYEVAEPFGEWYAKRLYKGFPPTREEGVEKLKKLISRFFSQWPDSPREYLHGFFMGVMREVQYVD